MSMVAIDGIYYELDDLSAEAKAQLASLQFVDAELQRLQAQTAVLHTARMAYARSLQECLHAHAPTGTAQPGSAAALVH